VRAGPGVRGGVAANRKSRHRRGGGGGGGGGGVWGQVARQKAERETFKMRPRRQFCYTSGTGGVASFGPWPGIPWWTARRGRRQAQVNADVE